MDQNSLFAPCETTPSWPDTIYALPSENAPAPAGVSSQTYDQNTVRQKKPPSCTFCRRRKVKCDRANPCSGCMRLGAICVSLPPSGAPRGRKGGRRKLGSRLLDRILELENLVSDIVGEGSGQATAVPPPVNGNQAVRYLDSFSS